MEEQVIDNAGGYCQRSNPCKSAQTAQGCALPHWKAENAGEATQRWGRDIMKSSSVKPHQKTAKKPSGSGAYAESTSGSKSNPNRNTLTLLNGNGSDSNGFFHPAGGPKRFCTVKWRKPPRRSETIAKYRKAIEENDLPRLGIPVVAIEPLDKTLLQFCLNKNVDGAVRETSKPEKHDFVEASPERAEHDRRFEVTLTRDDIARPDGVTSKISGSSKSQNSSRLTQGGFTSTQNHSGENAINVPNASVSQATPRWRIGSSHDRNIVKSKNTTNFRTCSGLSKQNDPSQKPRVKTCAKEGGIADLVTTEKDVSVASGAVKNSDNGDRGEVEGTVKPANVLICKKSSAKAKEKAIRNTNESARSCYRNPFTGPPLSNNLSQKRLTDAKDSTAEPKANGCSKPLTIRGSHCLNKVRLASKQMPEKKRKRLMMEDGQTSKRQKNVKKSRLTNSESTTGKTKVVFVYIVGHPDDNTGQHKTFKKRCQAKETPSPIKRPDSISEIAHTERGRQLTQSKQQRPPSRQEISTHPRFMDSPQPHSGEGKSNRSPLSRDVNCVSHAIIKADGAANQGTRSNSQNSTGQPTPVYKGSCVKNNDQIIRQQNVVPSRVPLVSPCCRRGEAWSALHNLTAKCNRELQVEGAHKTVENLKTVQNHSVSDLHDKSIDRPTSPGDYCQQGIGLSQNRAAPTGRSNAESLAALDGPDCRDEFDSLYSLDTGDQHMIADLIKLPDDDILHIWSLEQECDLNDAGIGWNESGDSAASEERPFNQDLVENSTWNIPESIVLSPPETDISDVGAEGDVDLSSPLFSFDFGAISDELSEFRKLTPEDFR